MIWSAKSSHLFFRLGTVDAIESADIIESSDKNVPAELILMLGFTVQFVFALCDILFQSLNRI